MQQRLTVTAGVDQGRHIALQQGCTLVGGRPPADVQLADPDVAPLHCELRVDATEVVLVHLSTAGVTRVNGETVAERVLCCGDVIEMGQTKLQFAGVSDTASEQAFQAFRMLIEAAPNAMMLVDEQGRIAICNGEAHRIFGYADDELPGQAVEMLVPAAVRQSHREHRHAYAAHGDRRAMNADRELYGLKKDGSEVPLEVGLSPLQTDSGRFAIVALRDISQRRQYESALEHSQHELSEALEAAQGANRAKSTFLARMSHEIRTPINGVLGTLRLLENTPLNEQQREYAWLARHSAESLLRLLNDILDFSKIEAGKLELESAAFSLRDVIGDTLHANGVSAHEKGLELVHRIAHDVPDTLIGDAGRLQQIVVNLVGNAIKFTERGEIVASVRVETKTPEEVCLRFDVRDTGIGVPAAQQATIFQSFRQAEDSTTRRYGGSGLGLAISKYLTEMMGGSMGLKSREGEGSVFHFTAKFGYRPAVPQPTEALAGRRLLVVEPNSTNRQALAEMTAAWDISLVSVESGEHALRHLRGGDGAATTPFDLVVMARDMADMDGLKLGGIIRASAQWKQLPLVLMSSSTDTTESARYNAIGRCQRIRKPVRHRDLLKVLQDLLAATDKSMVQVAPDAFQARARSARILLAEDDIVNRKVAVDMLTSRGHSVVAAEDGTQAVEFSQTHRFDIILMDIQMPELDGVEATRRIRQLPGADGPRVPIVAMTAHALKGDRERFLQAGMDEYVSKPIDPDRLFTVINELLPEELREAVTEGSNQDDTAASADETILENRPEYDGVFDLDEARRRIPGGDGKVINLARMVCGQSPDLVKKIEIAIAEGDAANLQLSAHTLKSTAGIFGATMVYDAALQMETMGKERRMNEAAATFVDLKKRVSKFVRALESMVQR